MYNAKDGRKKGEGEGVRAQTPALAGVFIGKCMVKFYYLRYQALCAAGGKIIYLITVMLPVWISLALHFRM